MQVEVLTSCFSVMVIVYWALGNYPPLILPLNISDTLSQAFVVASAIPQVQTIAGLVAAVCIMQFTYTFPPLLLAGYYMRIDAQVNDPGDTWRQWSRWRRGLFSGKWHYKLFNIFLFLGSAAMACLGALHYSIFDVDRIDRMMRRNVRLWESHPGNLCHRRSRDVLWVQVPGMREIVTTLVV